MDTLPVEMVERIVQLLTPQDLARCSAVSREWREIFNEDWVWRPHCDPDLEEPLRTTPCSVTPPFVAQEAENSTLSPHSPWKLAFMREQHLWRNWGRKEITKKEVIIVPVYNNTIENVGFLSDTLVVVWYSNKIEVLDSSVMPATVVAKTDTSINIDDDECIVNGSKMLLVIKDDSIEVYEVDIGDSCIKIKHNIQSDIFQSCGLCLKEDLFFFSNNDRLKLQILHLNTGEILTEELCQMKNTYESFKISHIASSPTCDFVAVTLCVVNNGVVSNTYYIYSPKELTFLPGPVYDHHKSRDSEAIAVHGIWLALSREECKTVTVVNFQTREVILSYEVISSYCEIFQWCNGFVFCDNGPDKSLVQYHCPADGTMATVYESTEQKLYEIINSKFVAITNLESMVTESILKLSGRTVELCDISLGVLLKINRSCTRVLSKQNDERRWVVVSCLW